MLFKEIKIERHTLQRKGSPNQVFSLNGNIRGIGETAKLSMNISVPRIIMFTRETNSKK